MDRTVGMALEFFAAFILGIIIICCILERNKTVLSRTYLYMAVSCTVALLCEAISIALYENQAVDPIKRLLNTAAFLSGYSLAHSYVCYIAALAGREECDKGCTIAVRVSVIAGTASAILLIFGVWHGLFFTVEAGVFEAGRLFIVAFAYDVFAIVVGVLLVIRCRRNLIVRDIIALISFPFFICISAVLQYVIYKISVWLFLLASVSVFIIFIMIQIDRNNQNAEKEKQLVDMNIQMMLSQIQPHFLYNALSSIRRMIKKDPEVAETAIENFSMYLRKNLESMNRVEPIAFDTELKHVKEYLYLEKLRFENRLNVEYDIGYTTFVLPVLTLQPIVENAVKHGIMKKEEGGCIRLSTVKDGNMVILTIEDDGVGFLTEEATQDERVHIGFANVKKRIEIQCRGTVDVKSRAGEGTTVTVTLPLL